MPEIATSASAVPAVTPAAPAALPLKPSANSPAPAAAAPGTTATIDADADEVGKWAKLARTNREAKATIAQLTKERDELAALKPTADKAGAVEKLIKEGKFVEAAQAAGHDVEKLFAQWVESGEAAPAANGPPKELVEAQAKLDAIEKRLKDADDAKAKDDETAKTAAQEAQRAETVAGIATMIATDGARWARCAKDPAEASNDAFHIAVEKVKTLGRAVTDAEAKELFEKSLDQAEVGYKALAEKWDVPELPRRPARAATVAPDIRDYLPASRESSPVAERKPAVTLDGQRGALRSASTETKGKLTEAEAKAKALASIRAMKRA